MERNEYIGSDTWPPKGTKTVPLLYWSIRIFQHRKISETRVTCNMTIRLQIHIQVMVELALGDGVGPARQNENSNRKDQLVFEMNMAEKPLILLGPVSATLWLSSDAAMYRFYCRITGCFPGWKDHQYPGRRGKSEV